LIHEKHKKHENIQRDTKLYIVTQSVNSCAIQHTDFFCVFRVFRGLTAVFRLKNRGAPETFHTCQLLLKKFGMKCRRCGLVPGKAMDDKKQCEVPQAFHDQKFQPLLDETKQGKRTVLFVDAAHFS
jgi:hypothetical protein